ncbi:sugar ABC transporter substrate-binding protein [Pelagibacterium lentulum]|uniref:D-ribose ABC transporter substrate-binding protein n=1 Tax=Pelagibacterium lentulum TaxID=2029865 RepID=A0A916RNF9_9HYPH|nr:sugar ABC transporter substrate-binding protein [Pelagibacterium lentulum]GGA63024.1 D-ribose ABC transporter substrate-binding protein [Pelagibacterium lentulum]
MKTVLLAGVAIAAMTVSAHAQTFVLGMKGPGAGNPFWAAVEAGARDAGAEHGVEVIVVAPPQESDVQAQITQIEDLIAQGVDGIALAPTDPNALAPVVDAAIAQGIAVVFVDTQGINDGVSFIGTNNEVGAALAAQFICENVEEGADVAILQGLISQSTGQARAQGANQGLTDCGLNIVAEQPANWDRAMGLTVTENIITGNPNIRAIFGSNDNMALGAVEALKQAAMLDTVMVVGFDANPDAAASILAGEMTASVAQAPSNMGRFSIEALMALVNGEEIEDWIDTGTVLVDASNAAEYQ